MTELKSFFRRIKNQKVFFGINLLGLVIGICFAILAFLFAQNEYKYDKHFTNTNDVYLLSCNNGRSRTFHNGQPAVFMDKIIENVPEIQDGIRIKWSDENVLINETRVDVTDFAYVDSSFFNFLGWQLIEGNPSQVLSAPLSLTISEKIAKQYFKDESPVGQIVNIGNELDFTITGVFQDFPEQAYIDVNYIASISSYDKISMNLLRGWNWHSSWLYLKLPNNADIALVEHKIAKVWDENTRDVSSKGDYMQAKLQPFKDNYLKSGEFTGFTDPLSYVVGFSIIAALILIISCFNFINLTIALNAKHVVDNGIKRVLGAGSKSFLRKVSFEISFYIIAALGISLIIISLLFPVLNSFLGKQISLSLVNNGFLWLFITALSCVIFFVCGGASILQIVGKRQNNLSNSTKNSKSTTLFSRRQKGIRNSLVVTQFAIGIVLVISAFIVNKQLSLIRQHDTGFNKEQIVAIENYEGETLKRYELLANILQQYPEVISVTSGSNVPLQGIYNYGGAEVPGNELQKINGCGFISVDSNYLSLIGAEFIDGRNFSATNTADRDQIIISESMAKALNLENPTGKYLTGLWDNKQRLILGVVKNIEYESLHEKELPVVFFYRRSENIRFQQQIMVKMKTQDLAATIADIEKQWMGISPDYPFKYSFLDEMFEENYLKEIKTASILNIMTVIAIVLCCLGLFALALSHIDTRIKEIGVRKVNGAKIAEVILLINKDFIIWIVIASLIAMPVAYIIMRNWLGNFALKTELNWWVFFLSGIITLVIALATISWQSWRAATRNPVEALRYE